MISVITVTYGNRWQYLQQVLSGIINNALISEIVVVDNGSTYDLKSKLNQFSSSRIFLISLEMNMGSAYGFKAGIEYLWKRNETSFIYLLDDDNVIEDNAIEVLISSWNRLECANKNLRLALLSLRSDRKYLTDAAKGESLSRLFPSKNFFLGFDLFHFPLIIYHKLKRTLSNIDTREMNAVKIPMAPYGGLFFHRDILSVIGLPDERFFVYTDDFEFTYRITKAGGEIWLIPESKIHDVSINQLYSVKHGLLKSRYLEAKGNIAYFSVRNPTFFSSQKLVRSPLVFRINIAIYSCYLFMLAIFTGKFKQFKVYLQAVNDGLKGNFHVKQINEGEKQSR